MSNELYTSKDADRLIALWSPRLIDREHTKMADEVYINKELVKVPNGDLFEIWVQTDKLLRNPLNTIVMADTELFEMHLKDIQDSKGTDETSWVQE